MTKHPTPTRQSPSHEAHARISQKLKALYNSVQDEAIPDRFLDLLERLDAADKAAEKNDGHPESGA